MQTPIVLTIYTYNEPYRSKHVYTLDSRAEIDVNIFWHKLSSEVIGYKGVDLDGIVCEYWNRSRREVWATAEDEPKRVGDPANRTPRV